MTTQRRDLFLAGGRRREPRYRARQRFPGHRQIEMPGRDREIEARAPLYWPEAKNHIGQEASTLFVFALPDDK